jgi:hypothetical protein
LKDISLVEFTETMRHRCRKCRSKLPTPTSNEREAFCCRGCYEQHYRKRCRVCEQAIDQKAGAQRVICKKATCKGAWRQKAGFGRFLASKSPDPSHTSSAASVASEVPVPQALFEPSKAVGWRIIAGPELSPDAFHAATVPDGPNGWVGGSYPATEARNKAVLEAHREQECIAALRKQHDWQLRPVPTVNAVVLGANLDIPEFLRRAA